jgi:mono/diheme cytochrome c family protein
MATLGRALVVIVLVAVLGAAVVAGLNRDDDLELAAVATSPADAAATVKRGEYLVRAGSCFGCHTEPGGAAYAGGRAIETPFGVVHAPNLTPDPTGLAGWTNDDFWRALHNGRARDGRLLYPAFPYPNYTRLARADSDAMFAYLQSLAPVAKPNARMCCAFRSISRQRSRSGARCSSARPGSWSTPPSRRHGTAAPTSSRRSATATRAIRSATCSVRPRARSTSPAA